VLSGVATGKWLLAHEFPTFLQKTESDDYWVSGGWLYQEGTIGTESGVNGFAKHDDYGGYVRGRKPNDADRATGYRIRAKEAEILLAREAGFDGFVHNLVDATPGSTMARRWLDLAEAAENLYAAGTLGDFRIALCPDGNSGGTPRNAPTDNPVDLEDLIVAHGARNSCLRLPNFSNNQLLFSFSPETAPTATGSGGSAAATWWANRKSAVAARGHPVTFAAIFQNSWTSTPQAPSFTSVADIFGRWGNSDWSSVLTANNDNANAAAYSMSQYGKPWCHYSRWQESRPYSQQFWEAWGSTLVRNIWSVIVASNPFMVQAATWDDYSEGTEWFSGDPYHGFVPADIQQYHAVKWKLGAFPTVVRDGLFLFHRVQPRSGVTYTSTQQTAFMPTTPVAGGAAKDEVEILAYLKAPATIYATSGGAVTPFAGAAGENSFKIPLTNGTVQAWAVRSGVTVASITSPYEVSTTQLVQSFKYRAVGTVVEEDEEGEALATPDTISGLIGWWKADDLAGAHGSTVNPWNSNGSYGPDLDETTTTAPTLDTSVAINSIPGVRFTASASTLRDTTSGTLSGFTNGVGGASVFVVAKLDDHTASGNKNALVVATNVAGASRYAMRVVLGVPRWTVRRLDGIGASDLNGSVSIGITAPKILSGTVDYNTTTQKLYVNAAEVASTGSALSSGTTATSSAGVGIGSHAGNDSEGWPGVIYEVVMYSRALTTLERMTVHAYLAAKYSITIVDALILPLATFGTMTTAFPQTVIGVDASIAPSVVSTATTVPTATKSTGSATAPGFVATTTATPSKTVSGGATVTATIATTTTTVPSRTVAGSSTTAPSLASTTTAIPARTVSGASTPTPGAFATTTSLPAAALATSGTVTPAVVSITTTTAAPSVSVSGNVSISATLIDSVSTVPAAATSVGSTVTAGLTSTSATVDGVSVSGLAFIAATSVTCLTSIGAVDVSVGSELDLSAVSSVVVMPLPGLEGSADVPPILVVTVGEVLGEAGASAALAATLFETATSFLAFDVAYGAGPTPEPVSAPVEVPACEVSVPPTIVNAVGREYVARTPRSQEVT
jgi:hypothetical protein